MALAVYQKMRDFKGTREPRGNKPRKRNDFTFVVQQHDASHLHYDFRLELDGVLLSWAIPKGPSLDPKVKRLAMQTEDHPLEYGKFEGVIPKGHYGAGTVVIWDHGHWVPEGDPRRAYEKGHLEFELQGEKLQGKFHLVRTHGKDSDKRAWLLMKSRDAAARSGHAVEVAAAMPEDVELQLASLVDVAPEGDDWLHELKLDGYRILARRDSKGGVKLLTRNGHDWTARMPTLARAISQLPLMAAIFDGELVVMNDQGVSDFQSLQNSLSAGKDGNCLYYVFDLLYLGHHDLRGTPLLERKEILRTTLEAAGVLGARSKSVLRLSDHVIGNGRAFFARACELGAEGSICKRVDARYVSGRSRTWLKVKGHARHEFVIGGYTEPERGRKHFGALLVGVDDEQQRLRYAGKVGTGFSERSLQELHEKLTPLERDTPAFDDPPTGSEARGVHWLKPQLVAEIEYAQRTQDGRVRHASFQGLRQDKPAADVRDEVAEKMQTKAKPTKKKSKAEKKPKLEKPSAAAGKRTRRAPKLAIATAQLSHPDRVLYPEQGITKAELALYYAQVASFMLPHLVNRPLMLMRCPEGQGSECFFQKHPSQGLSDAIKRVSIRDNSGSLQYMSIDDAEGLMGVVQLGALELHTWGSRVDQLETPDQLIFDLDPDEGLPWARVIEAALTLRAELDALELKSFLKTTGGKGLHVVVPIAPKLEWDAIKAFCKALVEKMASAEPALYLATMSKAKRKGRIFLDYLRNGRGATAVCAYSTRARSTAPVSMPIAWSELTEDLRSDQFTLENTPEHLAARKRDPWAGFFKTGQALTPAMLRALGA